MKKQKHKNSGITLIALIITVIVLLILAGITINLTIGQEGVINIAEEVGINYTNSANYEINQLAELNDMVENIINAAIINNISLDGSYSKKRKVNSPKLEGSGLIPVTINSDGTLENADTTNENWYNYDSSIRHWANAKTAEGSMFVWIPRFAYKINADQSIDVVFLKDTTNLDSNGNDVTSETYVDENNITGAYIVHPAFEDGSQTGYPNGEWNKKIEGFWMAKFEAGYSGIAGQPNTAVDSNILHSSTDNSVTSNYYGTIIANVTKIKYPVFQANKPSMNYIVIKDAYDLCMDLTSENAPYQLTNKVKPHLTKKSEWGAVAYLTQSKYGRNKEEVTINNVSANGTNKIYAVTGYGATEVSSKQDISRNLETLITPGQAGSWITVEGKNASSTKNLYGIYDLSGGARGMDGRIYINWR